MGDIDDKRDLTPEAHKIDGEIVELNLELKGDFVQSNHDYRPQKVASNPFSCH
jgi:hypothetical protein